MVTAGELTRLALALKGTTCVPHFDRTAFKAVGIYATLAADGQSINLKLTPDEQHLKCLTAPECFTPVPNAWGRQGWTTVALGAIEFGELAAALALAWSHARAKRPRG